MTIASELKEIIEPFSAFDEEKNLYIAQLDISKLLILEERFIKWLDSKLLNSGLENNYIEKNYKKLTISFHPDKQTLYPPEISWLDRQLSGDLLNGGCFKTLRLRYEKLTQPAQFKEVEYGGIHNIEEFKKWLEKYKETAPTWASKSLCDSLIALINASSDFYDSTGKLKPLALKTLVQLIPTIIAGFGTTLFFEELFLVYALYYVLLKGGQKLGKSDYRELKAVGQSLQSYTAVTAMVTTTLIVRMLELVFWTSRQSYTLSLEIGSSIFGPFLSQSEKAAKEEVDPDELCRELLLASKKTQTGMQFVNPELKLIAAPFEKYLAINAQQFFGTLRVGDKKRKRVEGFLFNLKVLDSLEWSLDEKYDDITKILTSIKRDKEVYSDGTKRSVDYIEEVISVLRSPEITALVPYEAPGLI